MKLTSDAAGGVKQGLLFLALVFTVVLIRTAWLSDDALITLRTVLNVTHGFGLTFNIAERVQTFTHPLWLAAITIVYLVIGNLFYATFLLSFAASIAAFWLVLRGAMTMGQAWVAAALLIFSRAFVDYSTSGLENPLSHLLLVTAAIVFSRTRHDGRWLTWLVLLASLLYLTRPDAVLIIVPMLAIAAWEVRRAGAIVRAAALGILPALGWTLFSIAYYGFPFPNTAYAKLATGIAASERWRQGVLYLIDSLDRDPLTLTTMAVAIAGAAIVRTRLAISLASGIVVYLLYVVSIGGDFMAGRFLTLPFVAAVVIVARSPLLPRAQLVPAAVALAAAIVAAPQWPLRSDAAAVSNIQSRRTGIVDERAVYFPSRSLLHADRRTFVTPDWPVNDGQPRTPYVLDTCGLMGAGGLDWGPYTHLLDECALADPLLARLPSIWNEGWRPGHFRRLVPEGYRESLRDDANRLKDAGLAAYYDELREITRGPIWSADRWRRIGRMNRGVFNHLINWSFYRYAGELSSLSALAVPKPDGTPRDAAGNIQIVTELAIPCEDRRGRRDIDISVDADDAYRVSFLKGQTVVSYLHIGATPEYRRPAGLITHRLEIPQAARARGFDTIVIVPGGGDNHFAIGHLLLDGEATTDPILERRRAAGR